MTITRTQPAVRRRTIPAAVPRRTGLFVRQAGFTLVELLAVMLIIAVLVSLMVAVGTWVRSEASRRKTAAIQDVAMQAVQAFYDEVGDYPGVDDPTLTGGMPSAPDADETTAVLLEYLRADESRVNFDDELTDAVRYATRDLLANLPAGGIDESGRYLLDGHGQRMHYDPEGGLGGRRPVLISAGPSGDFDRSEDNIRSDEN